MHRILLPVFIIEYFLFLCLYMTEEHLTALTVTAADVGVVSDSMVKYLTECLEKNSTVTNKKKMKKKNSRQRKRKEKPFYLHFGDGAVEGFNVIDHIDAADIRDLAACVENAGTADTDSGSVLALYGGSVIDGRNADGKSEVLMLSGIFQEILPDLHAHLNKVMQDAVRKAEWGPHSPKRRNKPQRSAVEDISLLGVRSIYLLTQHGDRDLEEYFAETNARAAEIDSTRNNFVIFPDEKAKQEHEEQVIEKLRAEDPDTDEALMPFLKMEDELSGTAYTAVVLLSDRSEFAGGDVLARTSRSEELEMRLSSAVLHGVRDADQEDNEEDKDDDDYDGETDAAETDHMEKFQSGLYYRIKRYTPERYSLLLVNGAYGFGTQPVRAGRRQSLVIELWPFEDAHNDQKQLGGGRPAIEEAVQLPTERLQHWSQRYEL